MQQIRVRSYSPYPLDEESRYVMIPRPSRCPNWFHSPSYSPSAQIILKRDSLMSLVGAELQSSEEFSLATSKISILLHCIAGSVDEISFNGSSFDYVLRLFPWSRILGCWYFGWFVCRCCQMLRLLLWFPGRCLRIKVKVLPFSRTRLKMFAAEWSGNELSKRPDIPRYICTYHV